MEKMPKAVIFASLSDKSRIFLRYLADKWKKDPTLYDGSNADFVCFENLEYSKGDACCIADTMCTEVDSFVGLVNSLFGVRPIFLNLYSRVLGAQTNYILPSMLIEYRLMVDEDPGSHFFFGFSSEQVRKEKCLSSDALSSLMRYFLIVTGDSQFRIVLPFRDFDEDSIYLLGKSQETGGTPPA